MMTFEIPLSASEHRVLQRKCLGKNCLSEVLESVRNFLVLLFICTKLRSPVFP